MTTISKFLAKKYSNKKKKNASTLKLGFTRLKTLLLLVFMLKDRSPSAIKIET